MGNLNLCTKQKVNHIINNQPESYEVLVCISGKLNDDLGWLLSPYTYKQKIQNVLKTAQNQLFLSKNHPELIELLQNSLMPLTIRRVEISNKKQKRMYEI